MNFKNMWGHLSTITKHRNMVIRHCRKAGIFWQGLGHDLSKYGPAEFLQGVKYYQGTRSPTEQERAELGYSAAWMHHKGRNRHHFEYWTDYCKATGKYEPVKMPKRFVVEMFCDRVAAGKIYNGKKFKPEDPLLYFLRGKESATGEPIRSIHPETSAFLEKLLRMYAEKGEEETFAYLRTVMKEKGEY